MFSSTFLSFIWISLILLDFASLAREFLSSISLEYGGGFTFLVLIRILSNEYRTVHKDQQTHF